LYTTLSPAIVTTLVHCFVFRLLSPRPLGRLSTDAIPSFRPPSTRKITSPPKLRRLDTQRKTKPTAQQRRVGARKRKTDNHLAVFAPTTFHPCQSPSPSTKEQTQYLFLSTSSVNEQKKASIIPLDHETLIRRTDVDGSAVAGVEARLRRHVLYLRRRLACD
ncbi:hypothetical protein KCU96_g15, partial [Aureobasidium melanogenum]